jgi:adenosylcobinamide kinase/adenosylcobinamide-phosphate guanylyltransferase
LDRRLTFILGGARSGKSRYAETWGHEHGQKVLFVATAEALDDEMRQRIVQHQSQRPGYWQTLEAPLNTGDAIRRTLDGHDTVIVDCITLLASNVLLSLPEDCSQEEVNHRVLAEIESLLNAYADSQAVWLVVSNEVGMSVVPATRLGRLFRDTLGSANQHIAQAADEVLMFVAGMPWVLKSNDGRAPRPN